MKGQTSFRPIWLVKYNFTVYTNLYPLWGGFRRFDVPALRLPASIQIGLSREEVPLIRRHRSSKTEEGNTMEMKKTLHPGALVADCLAELGFSVAEAAAGLGITRQQLHNVIAGRSNVTPEMAIRFEKAFGSAADTWLRLQMNYDLAQIRKRAAGIAVERLTPKVA